MNPQVILQPRRARPFYGRHPWVYAGAVAEVRGEPADGDEVDLYSHAGDFIARGLYNSRSKIRVRLYSWSPETALDAEFFRARLNQAIQLRDMLGLNKPGAAFISIHQYPAYPGSGTEDVGDNCFNYPVAPQTPRAEYRRVLTSALERLQRFKPEIVAVSAGFDAYARDPLLQLTLEGEDFAKFGDWLSKINVPVAVALEGGYSNELPELIDAFLTGWQS